MRRKILIGLAVVLLCFAGSAEDIRPNLILIVTDDQGYGDLSAHGNPHLRTPHLDQLRAEGTALDRFYVSPVCSPTRASLMTGRYNYRTGVVDTYIGRSMMHASERTLAEMLRDSGYRTGIFGKWHLGDTYPLRAMDQGFEESLVNRGGGIGQPSDPPDNGYFNPRLQHNGEEKPFTGYCTDIITSAAIDYMRREDPRPFFVYLTPVTPHTPLQVDPAYVQPFLDMGLDEKTAKVYGMIVNIDENVGRLLAALEEDGRAGNTLVVFITDNGPQQMEGARRHSAGMRGAKGEVYEGGIRVPCLLRWPGVIPAGASLTDVAAHIDLLPTLLEAAGRPLGDAANIDGRSLWSRVLGGPPLPERFVYAQWHRGDEPEAHRNAAVISSRFKLVNGTELYDLAADPSESNDISGANPEEAARLREAYDHWFADVSASRGYAPPRIPLAPLAAPDTLLTPQDWRGSPDFGASDVSYWEVVTHEGGTFRVTLDFGRALEAGRAELRIGGERHLQEFSTGTEAVEFMLQLGDGIEDRLAFLVSHASEGKAVRYVRVQRASESK